MPNLHDLFVLTAPRGGPFTQSRWDQYWGRTRALFMERLPESHHLHQRVRRCIDAGINPAQAPEGQGNFVTYELRHYVHPLAEPRPRPRAGLGPHGRRPARAQGRRGKCRGS